MYLAFIMRSSFVVLLALVTACHASVSAKANTNGEASASASDDMKAETDKEKTTTPPPTTPPAATAAMTTTTAAPASASGCPFQCFIADGADMTPIAPDVQESLRGAFADTMNGMHQCTGNDGRRHRSSPVLNVRVSFEGAVTDVGVDTRGYDTFDSCLQSVAKPIPSGTFPGPADIRCSERCEKNAVRTKGPRTRATHKSQAPSPSP